MLGSVKLGSVHCPFSILRWGLGDSILPWTPYTFFPPPRHSFNSKNYYFFRSMRYIIKSDQNQSNSFGVTTPLMVVGRPSCHMKTPRRTFLLACFVYGSALTKVHSGRSSLKRMGMKEVVVLCVNCMCMEQQFLFMGETPPSSSTKYVLCFSISPPCERLS